MKAARKAGPALGRGWYSRSSSLSPSRQLYRRSARFLGEVGEMGSVTQDVIDSFKEKAAKFGEAYRTLLDDIALVRSDPALYAEGMNIKSTADSVVSKIQWINRQVDSTADWIFGGAPPSMVNGMGAIPLVVGAAVIAAALAAMAYVASDAYQFHQKAQLVRTGRLPASTLTGSITGNLSNMALYLAIGAVAIFVLPKLMRK